MLMTTPWKIVKRKGSWQWYGPSNVFSRLVLTESVYICKAAEQTDSPPTKTVLRVLQKQKYPQDYVQFLNSFHIDEPGLVMWNDEFLKEFRHIEFKIWKGSTIKSTEILNTFLSKLRRLARLFIHFQNVYSREGHRSQELCWQFKVGTTKLL